MKEKDFKNRSALAIFMSYYRPHIKLFIIDMLCALLVTATDLAFPYVSKLSMQTYLPQGLFKTFFIVMAILVAAYIIKAGLYYIITAWGHLMATRMEADMRNDIFRHYQKLSFSFFDQNRTGILMSRATNDLFEVTELAHHGPEDVVMSVLTLVGSLIILFTVRWELALMLSVLVPLFVCFTMLLRRWMFKVNLGVKQRYSEVNALVESGISGIRTSKAFTNEESEAKKFAGAVSKYVSARKDYFRSMAVFHSGMQFFTGILQVVVIAAGGYFIMKGRMDYIDLITFSLYVSTFVAPIRNLAAFVEQYVQGMAGFTRFLQIMRTEPEVQDAPDAEELTDVRGEVEYKNVCFDYGNGVPVLEDINLKIHAGECVAAVGPSGGGKTTMCHLLPRFYDVTGGSITIDGKDVRSVTQESLRKNIGIIQQDVFLFADTIMENIRYGRPDATDEEVMEAAKKAEIHNEILEMPDGYGTYVGERGVMLSGGQKQRISIARVFLKNPPVLILDEATSALDSVTEAKIQQALDELSVGRTTIIIAHRLSTIRNAGRIVFIEDDRILESGSHEELMAKDGHYARLYRAQDMAARRA